MKKSLSILSLAIVVLFASLAIAADKVVVIPLGGTCDEPSVPTVTSAGGQVWMDRNLGASQVATSSTDSAAYGDMYQWGRGADGHERRVSATTTTLSTTDVPGHGSFILSPDIPFDWRQQQNDNLWQGTSGTNNPCPPGFRLPTIAEWEIERASWSSNDATGAFASPLKLVAGGVRASIDGIIYSVGSEGLYSSSTVSNTMVQALALNIGIFDKGYRAEGYSVRCIKD